MYTCKIHPLVQGSVSFDQRVHFTYHCGKNFEHPLTDFPSMDCSQTCRSNAMAGSLD